MRWRARSIAVFAVLAAFIAGWLMSSRQGQQASERGAQAAAGEGAGARSALDLIPREAMLVATVDVASLRQTELGRRFLGRRRRIPGLGLVPELCGSDPMDRVSELAVAVPSGSEDADFGVFAIGSFDPDELLSCAHRIIEQQGGRAVMSPVGGFRLLRDARWGATGAELGVGSRGALVLAEPAYVRESIDAAEGRVPSVRTHEGHRQLRELVGASTVVLSVVLTAHQRATLLDELARQGARHSPFARIESAALGARLHGPMLHLRAVIACDGPGACGSVARALEQARREQAEELSARLWGLDALLDDVVISAAASRVDLRLSLPVEQALGLLDHLLERSRPRPPIEPPASAAPAERPDAGPAADAQAGSRSRPHGGRP